MIKDSAIETLKIEAASVTRLIERIDGEFEAAVKCILDCHARVVVTGMGKSGHIGRKIAASLASTGTPAFFMHPAEAFHGDLGMVTATLAMGDAITVALLEARNFTKQDFALFHPGGSLGRKLLLTVENVMHSGEDNPIIHSGHTAQEALFMMTDKGLGATSVVNDNGEFIGLVTDGDIRRGLAKGSQFLNEAVETTGDVIAAALISDEDNLLVCGLPNSICISATEIPLLGRTSVGNQVMKGSKILSVSKV